MELDKALIQELIRRLTQWQPDEWYYKFLKNIIIKRLTKELL